jgi:segregation and condensation protein B
MPALETLAVISYKQPVTAPEIQEIRGVNTSGVLKTLLDKRLITTAGRKEVMGRPILYRTSKEFLMRFGLSDLQELPSLKEFEALAREALGTDEGIATPGAGDESVLDGITRGTSAEGESVSLSETPRAESAEDVASQPSPEVARAEDGTGAEEVSQHRTESTPESASQKTVEEAPAVDGESKAEEFAETNEGKSHGAAAGE